MAWQKLLAERKIQRHKTDLKELNDLRALIKRDLDGIAMSGGMLS